MTWLWWWCWLLLFLLFLDMMNDIGIDKKQQLYIIKKIINIAIRATYYIFCCRNRNWDSPDLMQFWYLLFCFSFLGFVLFFCLFVFFFSFLFLIIQSQAAFVNCHYVARFTIVHSNTQIKFPLLLLLLSPSSLLLINYYRFESFLCLDVMEYTVFTRLLQLASCWVSTSNSF